MVEEKTVELLSSDAGYKVPLDKIPLKRDNLIRKAEGWKWDH